ncbi:MAG TPA: sulfide/dihydroorotate dehydrogenase-like FAD/NAD-binding protein [Bacteroidota bacterium]|jgi:ferredoxin--NADP+ reductase|nr:sulfide/dihydroorotate dehydrogenase-like FAD/NAD-binding protein [Bacteroidota bacterium]
MFPIIAKELLAPTLARFSIQAPYVARKSQAGNFVIIRVEETGERIPLTVVETDLKAGTITLIVQAVGKTTNHLLTKMAGEALVDVVGPLGNPTPIEYHGSVACIGGGVGTAELLPIARALKSRGNAVYTVIGARSKDLIILEPEMAEFSDGMFITTDDGSYRRKGFVTDQLKDLLDAPIGIGAVYAIGPLPMMKAVAALTRKYGVKTIVSLNTIMVDGTGMCGGCRVTVDKQMKFACVDGPEFDAHTVDFDELIMRNRTYVDMEKAALHPCKEKTMELHEAMMYEIR